MKLAVMSDIHSNVVAFDVCISYIEENPVDGIVLLGDYVSDCPDPQLTLDKIRLLKEKYPVYMIRGNREEYFLNYRQDASMHWDISSYQGSLLYTYERLSEEDIDWFGRLKSCEILNLEGVPPISLVHGSPGNSRELLEAEKENTKKWMREINTDYMLCGHTHRQMIYQHMGRTLINPGSVGVPLGVSSSACMAYLTGTKTRWNSEFISLPYFYEKVEQWFHSSSLEKMANVWPKCILESIKTGENMGPLCAKRAYDLAIQNHEILENGGQGGKAPEHYWEIAARELGVI